MPEYETFMSLPHRLPPAPSSLSLSLSSLSLSLSPDSTVDL